MNLPEFSVNKRVTVTMLTILVIIFGVITFSQMGLEMMPDMDYPVVSIVTIYPGASSEDIEKTLTKPLESVLAGVKGIKSIKSQSSENQSVISVEFRWGTNLDFAAQDLRDAMDMISDQLPDDANKPMVMKMNMADMPVLVYGIVGKDTYKTRKFIEDDVEQKLKHLDGVASVMILGGKEPEKQIVVDKTKLERNNISIDDIVNILKAQNLNIPASHIVNRQSDFLIRTVGEFQNIKEIENTPISISQTGNLIYIKDVATVLNEYKEQRFSLRTNKKESVMMMVSKESGANTLSVGKSVKEEIAKIIEEFPQKGIEFIEIMDQGQIVEMVTTSSSSNAIMGGLLAIIVMFLFLRNWRPTLAISLAIPISVIATFIPLYLAKYSLNMMTLGGLALGVGMLVDNAVVVIENIYRHLEMGDDRITSAKVGATEVGMAITASTLTTVSVFFPMMFSGGIAGQMVRSLALTVSFALFASLFVSLTLVPMIASVLFKKHETREEYEKAAGEKGFGKLKKIYLIALKWSLRHRTIVLVSVFFLFVGSLLLIPKIGTEFMPKSDMPMQIMKIRLPAGASLEETDIIASRIENIISEIKEVKYVMVDAGVMSGGMASMDPSSPTGVNEAVIFFRLVDKEDRERVSDEIMEEVRRKAPDLKNVELTVIDMSTQMSGSGESAPVTIKLYGKDLNVMREICDEIAEKIKPIEGIRDVNNSLKDQQPERHIVVDRDKAFRYGLTVAQIGSAIRTSTLGTESGIFRDENGDEIDIRVRLKEESRNSLQEIENINISSPLGFSVPLKQIAEIKEGYGPLKIEREHQIRKATVTANIFDRNLGTTIKDVKESISDIQKTLPSGYFIEFGGSYKDMKDSFKTLIQALLLAIVLIYVVMASQFESFSQPFIIMFTMPLAVIGVILAFFVTGTTLSVTAFIGIIILAGIVVNNGIVLVDHANQLRNKGIEKHQALLQAGQDRIRPVLITSITTIMGMLPMAISTGQGSEMRSPMAIAVIGGLISATFFTLLVVPSIYSIVDHISYKTEKKIMSKLHGKEDNV